MKGDGLHIGERQVNTSRSGGRMGINYKRLKIRA